MALKHPETFLPRLVAVVVLVVSISLLVPIVFAVVQLVHGASVPAARWAFPMTLLAAGAVLISFLGRKQIPVQVYALALTLWLIVAGYYWVGFLRG